MNEQAMRVAWYRYRATFASQLSGYLSIVLLIGLIGGVAMASVAAGRRTQSSFPTFIASTNPSNLVMAVFQAQANTEPNASLKSEIERLPDVTHVATAGTLPLIDVGANGAPRLSSQSNINIAGSLDGMTVDQDRLAVVKGRAANPSRADEIVMNAGAARILRVHVGQVIALGLYTQAQMNSSDFGSPKVKPVRLFHEKLVGIVALNTQLVQDDVDQTYGDIFVTAALIRQVAKPLSSFAPVLFGIQLRHGDVGIAKVQQELVHLVPKGEIYEFHVASTVTSQVDLAIKPESVALGAFGAFAALACLILSAQAISRLLRRGERDRDVLRALGASPLIIVVESLIGVLFAVALGTLVAAIVAVALSPLGPIGPVRPVYPDAGFAIDWTVAGIGVAVLIVGLGAIAIALGVRGVTKGAIESGESVPRRSKAALGLQRAGVPVAGVVGVHFALEPGRGRSAVPVRSIIGSTVIAVAMVAATLTFSSGFSTLISRPPLYGWNWTYLLNPSSDVPPQALSLLHHDHLVAAWSGADYTDLQIDGEELPILLQNPGAKVSPPILSGHGLATSRQIVLGAGTLAHLHKRIGDTVTVSLGSKKDAPYYIPPTPLVIVGTATLPAVGYSSFVAEHTSMGTGALIPLDFTNVPFSGHSADPNLNGPELVFVTMKAGVSQSAGRQDMQRIVRAANRVFAADKNAQGNSVEVLGVLRPVQIVNYRSIGSTPVFLAAGLALGAVLALGLTLASSVRRRRRDLALLKTFGFTHRQLASAVAWQATTTALIGVVVGLPVGVVIGRQLWTLFARSIYAVPDPTIPWLSVVAIGFGTLVFANLVAVLPGRSAASTPAALALRAE
ncbi:MAG: FtsX-like permease family protein [Acidimicrobiales bacterium]